MARAEQGAAGPVRMQLNEADAGPGGGGQDLSVHDDELGALGNMAHELHGRLSTDGEHAKKVSGEAASSLKGDGFDTGSALGELNEAWKTKLATLLEACAHISNHLDYSRAAHKKDEDTIATNMRDAEGRLMSVSRIAEYIK
ncbi:hypothetical protein DVA86_23345 [Streptomyces armeniacus]|uniref:ESX-1 secretion-associated protein n=2 Tax=Streptomyces armeniacus TaxID=83291 RepID=A0A345Y115_9ACTN|nr:hypothetical protein DVA86_23345 [Streptomyces armeniacus]